MVEIRSDRHLFLCGKTRSGKTEWLRALLNRFPRVLIHDRKNEWYKWGAKNHFLVIHTIEQLTTALTKGYKRIIYMPQDPSKEDFDDVCHLIFQTGNIYFCVDEAQSYSPHGVIGFWFGELMRLGAGRGIGVCSLVQRPRETNNTLISEATVIVSFRLQLLTDRQKMSSTVGKEVEETLRVMPPYHYMLYEAEPDTITWCSPIPFRG